MIQLGYISKATHPFSGDELGALLKLSRTNNEAKNISGVLLYHEGSFLQLLEGPRDVVNALYKKIAADPRHDSVSPPSAREIVARQFGQWSMGFAEVPPEGMGAEGFTDFLRSGDLDSLTSDGGRIATLLRRFREKS